MTDFFKFQWLCLKEAWRRSFVIANAWYGLWGPILVWIGFSYWRGHPLMLPTKLDGYAVLLVFAFLGATWAGVLVVKFIGAASSLYWTQCRRAEGLIEALKTASGELMPDWPIHEVFSYLEPEALDRPEESLWQKAGDEIRDALSLGRLKIWGRPSETDLGKWVGERAALRLIDPVYWQKAFFTYMFFDSTSGDANHCYADRSTGRPAYTDLQVNRAQALKLWPGEPDDIAETFPNVRVADTPAVIELFEGRERSKLIGLLASEKLTAWARISASISSDLLPLEGKIWSTHSFRFHPKNADEGSINQTFLRIQGTYNSTHYDVCLNYAQLKRAWPHLRIHRSKCDVR